MAELTNLESKLGEVIGLAQAGQAATKKVKTLARKEKQKDLVETLDRMAQEAAETAKIPRGRRTPETRLRLEGPDPRTGQSSEWQADVVLGECL